MKDKRESRLPIGSSDPVSFNCACSASSLPAGGLVLLFYRYFSAPPSLEIQTAEIFELPKFHKNLTDKLHLGGKIRLGKEGFNITVGGTKSEIETYMKECVEHWSFANLDLDTEEKNRFFFKPTPGGCACVFGGTPASIRVTTEITPMGITNYIPKDWDAVQTLSPAEFHERCWNDDRKVLVDVRNHYESRIGYFVDPRTGEKAITPGIRRFSQWPQYIKTHMETLRGGSDGEKRQIMTYCTGGIRCEKGVRFMAETMEQLLGDQISTLKGGIAAYLMWIDEEIKQGRKRPEDSLFQGKNYVFDARGSTGLSGYGNAKPVATCDECGAPSDRLSKCRSKGCHLIMVVCSACESSKDPRCCQGCLDLDATEQDRARPLCACEKRRETQLWGDHQVIRSKEQGWRKKKRIGRNVDDINIRITTID